MIKAVIIDDHRLFAEGFKLLVESSTQIPKTKIIAVVGNGEELVRMVDLNGVDLFFLDMNLPGMSGIQILEMLKAKVPKAKILIVSAYIDNTLVRDAMEKGADGYLSKSVDLKEMTKGIEMVIAGDRFMSSDINLIQNNLTMLQQNVTDKFLLKFKLTKREKEILSLIINAKSNKDIANELFISPETVSVHRKNLMRKLSVNNVVSLIQKAKENSLI